MDASFQWTFPAMQGIKKESPKLKQWSMTSLTWYTKGKRLIRKTKSCSDFTSMTCDTSSLPFPSHLQTTAMLKGCILNHGEKSRNGNQELRGSHSCPGRWWSHQPWRCSRNVWTWCWGTWFRENYWWWVDGWTGWSCGSFPTLVILWFYEKSQGKKN